MKVSLRDVTIVRDETGDGVRVTSRTGSARRFVGDLKKVRELSTRRQTRRIEANLRPMGGPHEIGAK